MIAGALLVPLIVAMTRGEPAARAHEPRLPYTIAGYSYVGTLGGSLIPNTPIDAVATPEGELRVVDLTLGRVIGINDDATINANWAEDGLSEPIDLPARIATDDDGNLYVLQVQSGVVRKLSPDGQLLEDIVLAGGMAQIAQPNGLAIGPEGRIYISSNGPAGIQIFADDGQPIGSWSLDDRIPTDIVVTQDARVLVSYQSDAGDDGILVFSTEGEELADWPLAEIASDTDGYHPESLAVWPSGETGVLLLSEDESSSPTIVRLSPTGMPLDSWQIQDVELPLINGYLSVGIAIDQSGRVIVPAPAQSQVLIFDAEGGLQAQLTPINEQTGLAALDAIDTMPDGGLYALDPVRQQLLKYDANGALESTIQVGEGTDAPLSTGFLRHRSHVLTTPDGGALVISRAPTKITLIDPAGNPVDTSWDQLEIETVIAAAIDSQGRVLLVDEREPNVVQLYSLQGEPLGPLFEPFSSGEITDIAARGGKIYILEQPEGSSVIWTLNENGELTGDPLYLSIREGATNRIGQALAVTPEGELLLVASIVEEGPTFSFPLQRINPETGESETLTTLQTPQTTLPDLAVAEDGALYVANPNNREIYVYAPMD